MNLIAYTNADSVRAELIGTYALDRIASALSGAAAEFYENENNRNEFEKWSEVK